MCPLILDDTAAPGGNFPVAKAQHVAMAVQAGEAVLKPGIYYQFGEVSELAVELAPGFAGSANEYVFEFIPLDGFEKPVITPEVVWLGDPQFPVGKTCMVSVCMGLAVTACG